MAHKKGVGSTKNGRDSESKRLGVKVFGGQFAKAGNIIVRQRGTRFHPGEGVGIGKDHTIFATVDGTVAFRTKRNDRTYISVLPVGLDMEELQPVARKKAPAKKEVKEATPVVEEAVETAEAAPEVEAPEAAAAPETEAAAEEAAAPEAKAAAEEQTPPHAAEAAADDLKKIEGIGPKIAEILTKGGIATFATMAGSTPDQIREILLAEGKRYAAHSPDTWPQQAALAAEGKWDELQALQNELKGGRE